MPLFLSLDIHFLSSFFFHPSIHHPSILSSHLTTIYPQTANHKPQIASHRGPQLPDQIISHQIKPPTQQRKSTTVLHRQSLGLRPPPPPNMYNAPKARDQNIVRVRGFVEWRVRNCDYVYVDRLIHTHTQPYVCYKTRTPHDV